MSYYFILIIPRLTEVRSFKYQGHTVSLWRRPWTCDLKKCYLLRSPLGIYNLERRLSYLHLLTRPCPCNWLPKPTPLKHEYRWQLQVTMWLSLITSSQKIFVCIIWEDLFIFEVTLELCSIFQNHFEVAIIFLPEVTPEVEYPSKIAMSISNALSFWSTL